MADLTDEQLLELELLDRNSTRGAWEAGKYTIGAPGLELCWEIHGDNDNAAQDALCFAAARSALPALIAEVRAARRGKALDALSEQAQELGLYEIKNPPG